MTFLSLMIRIFALMFLGTASLADDNCRERDRLIENEKGDLYMLIDATLGQKLTMQCHYCNENDDGRPKVWYKIDEFGASEPHEVHLDMNNNSTENRIEMSKDHRLILHNFSKSDTGLYYCQHFEGEAAEKNNFLVDLISDENVTAETGNLTTWKEYYQEHFVPLNTLFIESKGTEFREIREEIKIKMEVTTEWGPWGICEVCGRPKNEGLRKRTGFCRIKLTQKDSGKSSGNSDRRFLKTAHAVPCRSQLLGRQFPEVGNRTRIIPNFIQIQACEGTCNPDAEGVHKGWKAGKTSSFKYRKTFVLEENSHLTLICPESTLDNTVVWKKNGKLLKAGESVVPPEPEAEPRILVDTFNTLYLVGVRESEEGNYTCQVDDIRMQQIIVFVISKSRLLTQAFVRHMMYLGLILSLTLPCYFSGLVITCSRKRYFKNYEELKEEEAQRRGGRYTQVP